MSWQPPTDARSEDTIAAWEVQRGRLIRLTELSDRQAELLGAGDSTGLVALLLVKQPLVEEIAAAQTELGSHRFDGATEESHSVREDGVRRCREIRAECERLLAQLITQEQAAEATALALRDSLAHQSSALADGQRARSAYQPFSSPRSS